jgi:hypothetical protein
MGPFYDYARAAFLKNHSSSSFFKSAAQVIGLIEVKSCCFVLGYCWLDALDRGQGEFQVSGAFDVVQRLT